MNSKNILINWRFLLISFVFLLDNIKILSIIESKRVPINAPNAEPIPPIRDAPPTTAEAMACNSKP